MIRRSKAFSACRVGKPRASGDDPENPPMADTTAPVNPARAGMILRANGQFRHPRGKPRASGDDPAGAVARVIVLM